MKWDRVNDARWKRMMALMGQFPLCRQDWLDVCTAVNKRDEPILSRNELGPKEVERVITAIEGYLIMSAPMSTARADQMRAEMAQRLRSDVAAIRRGLHSRDDKSAEDALTESIRAVIHHYRGVHLRP